MPWLKKITAGKTFKTAVKQSSSRIKTSQYLKARFTSIALQRFLKASHEVACLASFGREFHSSVATTEKVLFLGSPSSHLRRLRHLEKAFIPRLGTARQTKHFLRYAGLRLVRALKVIASI